MLTIVASNLANYMQYAKQSRELREQELEKEAEQNESGNVRHVFPEDLIIDGHYSHTIQVKERLSFIRLIQILIIIIVNLTELNLLFTM